MNNEYPVFKELELLEQEDQKSRMGLFIPVIYMFVVYGIAIAIYFAYKHFA